MAARDGRPIRPRTQFAHFVQLHFRRVRWENRPMDVKDAMRELARTWKELPNDAKEDFKDEEDKDRRRYRQQLKEWKRQFTDEIPPRKRQKRRLGYPKRNRNAYVIFLQSVWRSTRIRNPDYNAVMTLKAISKKWKKIPANERNAYTELAKTEKERCILEKKDYLRKMRGREIEVRLKRLQQMSANKNRTEKTTVVAPANAS